MTLPVSGPISMASINAEFSRGTDLNSYRGTGWYIDAGGSGTFPSGSIDFDIFRGKRLTAPLFSATINSNQQELNLRVWALNNGWNGSTPAVITVGSGVYIWSDNTGAAAMSIDGSWPGGVTLINNGFIIGRGGNGGSFSSGTDPSPQNGASGGTALLLGVNVTITNNSYIAGGGGGGAGRRANGPGGGQPASGGGGAGGGNGGFVTASPYSCRGTQGGNGGAGGAPGAAGGAGSTFGSGSGGAGGGGGRLLPGAGGSGGIVQQGGAGGGAGGQGGNGIVAQSNCTPISYVAGGGGGGWGASGGTAGTVDPSGASGGSANNPGTNASGTVFGVGGTGGNAVTLNGFSVTWNAFGTRYGAVA